MKAKDFLKQVEKLDKLIENKMIEREHWKSIALNVTSSGETVKINGVLHVQDKVQSSGNPQKMADAVAHYVDIEAEITECIDKFIDTKQDVISVIEKLNATEYDLMHKLYIQHMTMLDAAIACEKTYSWATTIHGRALKEVQKILDEREKKNEG